MLDKMIVNNMQVEEATEHINDEDIAPLNKKPITITKKRKKKTQLENPKIENWEPSCVAGKTKNISSLVNSSSTYHCNPPIIGLELNSSKHKRIGVGGKGSVLKGELLNKNNPVFLL